MIHRFALTSASQAAAPVAAWRRGAGLLLALAAVVSLSACSERPQDKAARLKSSDVQPWKGAGEGANPAYTEPGWQAGDRTAWQTQLRSRAQAQNEYQRSPAAPVGQQ